MDTYRMEDGTILKTENASLSWDEGTRWNGNNHVSIATGSPWDHQRLHRSRKGRYWIEGWSQWQGSIPYAEWIGERAAVSWLLANDHELPDDLKHLRDEVEE